MKISRTPFVSPGTRSVAEDANVNSSDGVNRICEDLFLSRRARERDDNLLFVRERMLRSEVDLAGLLSLYANVHRKKSVRDDETNPLVNILRLSGITRVEKGGLWVRNRIYARVFDQEWVKENMPDAELRRQQAAYRAGLVRAGSDVNFAKLGSAFVLPLLGSPFMASMLASAQYPTFKSLRRALGIDQPPRAGLHGQHALLRERPEEVLPPQVSIREVAEAGLALDLDDALHVRLAGLVELARGDLRLVEVPRRADERLAPRVNAVQERADHHRASESRERKKASFPPRPRDR